MNTIYDWLHDFGFEMSPNLMMDTAFVHTSYVNENRNVHDDNERLEFMGDAVLQIYSSTKLFAINPTLNEGQMTLYRAKLVNEQACAGYVKEYGLQKYLKLGVGEEKSGGREKENIQGDMFEAFIGAFYLVKGIDEAFKLLDKMIGKYFDGSNLGDLEDFKTKLQEFVQADTRKTVTYEVINTSGPSNAPIFEVVVKLEDLNLAYGKGTSKKRAEQDAAKNALSKMAR